MQHDRAVIECVNDSSVLVLTSIILFFVTGKPMRLCRMYVSAQYRNAKNEHRSSEWITKIISLQNEKIQKSVIMAFSYEHHQSDRGPDKILKLHSE